MQPAQPKHARTQARLALTPDARPAATSGAPWRGQSKAPAASRAQSALLLGVAVAVHAPANHSRGVVAAIVQGNSKFLNLKPTVVPPFSAREPPGGPVGRCLARPRAPTAARQRMALGGREADAHPRVLQARLVAS